MNNTENQKKFLVLCGAIKWLYFRRRNLAQVFVLLTNKLFKIEKIFAMSAELLIFKRKTIRASSA